MTQEARIETIKNWNDQVIPVIRSAGGVLATHNPFDNLIHDNIFPFPTPEIVQKLYKSRQERAFNEDIKSSIGYYADLQSLNSEDAITWSVFGTLMYSDSQGAINFTKKLFSILRLDTTFREVNVWLWRRIPHPDTSVSGGPEIDFGIQTENTIVLGEAKWLSKIGKRQGKKQNKDQIDLRIEFLDKYGRIIWPSISEYVIMGLSLDKLIVDGKHSRSIKLLDLSWDEICGIELHPKHDTIQKYLDWKKLYGSASN